MIAIVGSAASAAPLPQPGAVVYVKLQNINIFSADGRDPRQVQSRDGTGAAFSPIGVIRTSHEISMNEGGEIKTGIAQATAFLISPCLILTNCHAVFGVLDPVPPANDPTHFFVKFSVGSNGTSSGFSYNDIVARPIAFGRSTGADSGFGDWAILQLVKEHCMGSDPNIGWLDLRPASDEELAHADLITLGYPGDLNPIDGTNTNMRLQGQKHCRAYYHIAGTDRLGSDCSFMAGASGSPLIEMINDVPYVVGLFQDTTQNTSNVQTKYSEAYANRFIPISELDQQIIQIYKGNIDYIINQDVARHTTRNFIRPQSFGTKQIKTSDYFRSS